MTPLFFGKAERRLFGLYESPGKARLDARAILICYPWGPEYLYAHRALRQLATMLSAAGHHVFRFDYHGTGDSAGDMISETLESWQGDVAAAISELRALSGLDRITLIGMRLGATLAARAAATLPGHEVGDLILWDPIIDGNTYIQELLDACRAPHLKNQQSLARPFDTGGGQELLGYPVSDRLRAELCRIDLKQLAPVLTHHVFVICSSTDGEHERTLKALSSETASVSVEHYPGFPCWQEDWPVNVAIIPADVLSRIVDWLG